MGVLEYFLIAFTLVAVGTSLEIPLEMQAIIFLIDDNKNKNHVFLTNFNFWCSFSLCDGVCVRDTEQIVKKK